jgi:hypothetical protein
MKRPVPFGRPDRGSTGDVEDRAYRPLNWAHPSRYADRRHVSETAEHDVEAVTMAASPIGIRI